MAEQAGAALLALAGRVVVINLPDRADRRQAIGAELARLGLGLEHPAVTLFAPSGPMRPGHSRASGRAAASCRTARFWA